MICVHRFKGHLYGERMEFVTQKFKWREFGLIWYQPKDDNIEPVLIPKLEAIRLERK